MHGSFDKSDESDSRIHRNWGTVLYAVPALLAMVLIGMVIASPTVQIWLSQAAQAEFVDIDFVPYAGPARLAKPAAEIRTSRAN